MDKDSQNARRVLVSFARYGFKKTSMDEIAKALGISRQSVYKRFQSKDKCYETTIDTYLSGMYARIFEELADEQASPMQILYTVFDILIGEAVAVVHNPYGTDVLNDVLRVTRTSGDDWALRFRARLADFLTRRALVPEPLAMGTAFALISAGKGLVLEQSSRDQFQKDMQLIIDSVCHHRDGMPLLETSVHS